jgi:hypothetical protein
MTIAHHLVRLQVRIETIAANASRPGPAGLNLDDTLAALDLVGRRRVLLLLDMVQAFSEDEDERTAAEHIHRRAARAWYGSSVSFSHDRPDVRGA